jgi:hypothetical protein
MQLKVHGEMSLAEIRKALVELLHEVEASYAVSHSFGATLYINPTNGFGDRVTPRDEAGGEIKKVNCRGPYRSAADGYGL